MCARNVDVRAYGFIRVHVDRPHEPSGFVGADRQHAQIERPVAAGDFAELGVVRSVAGEVDAVLAATQRPAAPERAHAIERGATARVLRRYARDADAIGIDRAPPIELGDGASAPAPNVAGDAERREPAGRG